MSSITTLFLLFSWSLIQAALFDRIRYGARLGYLSHLALSATSAALAFYIWPSMLFMAIFFTLCVHLFAEICIKYIQQRHETRNSLHELRSVFGLRLQD